MNISKRNSKQKMLTRHLALVTREICEQLYNGQGASKVYDYANKINLHYNYCAPCQAQTPTIADKSNSTCAICGSCKTIIIES